jgi:rhamnose transport system ATP-binding protein
VSPPVLTLTDIRKSFGGVHALERVNLELSAGCVTALIGENGAGKSTLVKILSGVHQPDGGEVRVDGRVVRIANAQAARGLGLGVVHQECQVFDNLSVAENLFIHAQPTHRGLVNWRAMRQHAGRVLRDLDAGFDADLPAGRLSIAQKHLVQIARALTQESRVLILDEPTASLSQRECAELFRIVRKLRDAGCALLFISHKFEEIDALADRYAVLRDGHSVGAGKMAEVSRDELIRLMVGRPVEQLYPRIATRPGSELLRVERLGREGEFADISFTLRRGEILGVYGLVGAGRTELAQTLFGITHADHGSMHLAADAERAGIAMVPEDRQSQGAILDFSLTANVALTNLGTLAPRGWCSAARESALAGQWIERLSIKTRGPQQVLRSLSGGNQQKVVIAKWLARTPAVLILDEPTKGIDVGAKAAVHQVCSEFTAGGGGVIMISSDLPEILGMADRVLVMRRGRLRGEFSRAEATSDALLRAASDA